MDIILALMELTLWQGKEENKPTNALDIYIEKII